MGFFDETAKLLDLDTKILTTTGCYVTKNHGAVIEGYKKILELSSTKINLFCEDNTKLLIIGNNLSIKELSYKELSVQGHILSINFE